MSRCAEARPARAATVASERIEKGIVAEQSRGEVTERAREEEAGRAAFSNGALFSASPLGRTVPPRAPQRSSSPSSHRKPPSSGVRERDLREGEPSPRPWSGRRGRSGPPCRRDEDSDGERERAVCSALRFSHSKAHDEGCRRFSKHARPHGPPPRVHRRGFGAVNGRGLDRSWPSRSRRLHSIGSTSFLARSNPERRL